MRNYMNIIAEGIAGSEHVFYRGSPAEFAGKFRPAERGFFGPGVYGSAVKSVAQQYGDTIIAFHVDGDVFQAFSGYRGTLRAEPDREQAILATLSADERAAVLDWKSWYKDDSAAFWEAMKRRLGANRASEAFRAAGYVGIEGIGDGHEIVVFDPANIRVLDQAVNEAASSIRFLYHGTTSTAIEDIFQGGVHDPSYWGTEAVATHFARIAAAERGGEPMLIEMPIRFFNPSDLHPDENLMDFPIDFHGDASQDAKSRAWRRSKEDWRACLRIFGAALYEAPIRVEPHMVRSIGSAIREDVGDALLGTFYHGTSTAKSRSTTGLYVGNSLDWASSYARNAAEAFGGDPIVLVGRVNVANPAIVDHDHIEWLGYEEAEIKRLTAQGHDAAMREDGVELFLFSHRQFEVQETI